MQQGGLKDMSKQNIRDTFWREIYEQACNNKDIVIVSADLGAASLDDFRTKLPNQFISVGIAEQTAITVAAGLAMEGKKVYVYACAPFIFMRCYEQIKLMVAATNLPITIVGQGSGLCYAESCVTHHTLEDIGAIRMLPNLTLYTVSDEKLAKKVAELTLEGKGPNYIRIDRPTEGELYSSSQDICIRDGFSVLNEGRNVALVACGHMLHFAKEILDEVKREGMDIGLIDLYAINADEEKLISTIQKYNKLIVMEEHAISCGIGSYIAELCMDSRTFINLKRYGMQSKSGYCYQYGSRKHMWKLYGVSKEKIINEILEKGAV